MQLLESLSGWFARRVMYLLEFWVVARVFCSCQRVLGGC